MSFRTVYHFPDVRRKPSSGRPVLPIQRLSSEETRELLGDVLPSGERCTDEYRLRLLDSERVLRGYGATRENLFS